MYMASGETGFIIKVREQSFWKVSERAKVSLRSKYYVVYHVHKYNVILFERVKVMIALL